MPFPTTNSLNQSSKAMTPDQFDQVVEAIAEGRYSWACVLILRFAGYNPAHFIPYRTYSRLLKDHLQRHAATLLGNKANSVTAQITAKPVEGLPAAKHISLERDLEYTEAIDDQKNPVQGGYSPIDLAANLEDFCWRLWTLKLN